MGVLRNLVEPGSVAIALTVGALINTRTRRRRVKVEDDDAQVPLLGDEERPKANSRTYVPDNTRFRSNITSRFLAFFPFLLEIWYWNLTYWVYQLARAASATMIRGDKAVFDRARAHAESILSFEHSLRIDVELGLQRKILSDCPGLMLILGKIYYSHIFIGVVFIVYTYTYLPLPLFQKIRRTMAVDNLIAFIIITLWRCVPPRMLPEKYGFVDVLHSGPHSAWTQNRFQLTIAAMPSLHFGTSMFIGICLLRFAPHKWLRGIALLWPTVMLFTILATANHFLMDALVGMVIPAVGWRFNKIVLRLRPLEEWLFWLLRTEKPREEEIGHGRASHIWQKHGDWLA